MNHLKVTLLWIIKVLCACSLAPNVTAQIPDSIQTVLKHTKVLPITTPKMATCSAHSWRLGRSRPCHDSSGSDSIEATRHCLQRQVESPRPREIDSGSLAYWENAESTWNGRQRGCNPMSLRPF